MHHATSIPAIQKPSSIDDSWPPCVTPGQTPGGKDQRDSWSQLSARLKAICGECATDTLTDVNGSALSCRDHPSCLGLADGRGSTGRRRAACLFIYCDPLPLLPPSDGGWLHLRGVDAVNDWALFAHFQSWWVVVVVGPLFLARSLASSSSAWVLGACAYFNRWLTNLHLSSTQTGRVPFDLAVLLVLPGGRREHPRDRSTSLQTPQSSSVSQSSSSSSHGHTHTPNIIAKDGGRK